MKKFVTPTIIMAALAGIAAVATMIIGGIKTAKKVVYLEEM